MTEMAIEIRRDLDSRREDLNGELSMLLQDKTTGNLVKVMDVQSLINPADEEIVIRVQAGEEEQEPEPNQKKDLIFPSGEELPRCWLDADYRKD